MPKTPTVALVGRRLPHNENLGLAYLAAALREAGIGVRRLYVHDEPGLRHAIEALGTEPPDVLGLSLSDGGSALWPLALGEALERRGVRPAHVTAGGQFGTLAREWLLDRHRWLDSVVRFAGEVPLVEIVRRVADGRDVAGVPGVTTRRGDGPPAPVLDDTPMRLFPDRDDLPEVLGLPACHIAASRGCEGRCHYCGPAALHTLERAEGRATGASLAVLNDCGVGGLKSRAIDRVCDEMAALWHGRGVRYFYFVDEHLLPYREPEALSMLAEWKAGLARREVGPLGIGAMLRADRITPRVADAFRDVGLVRCFVGLEIASKEEGRRFGRPPPSDRDLALIGHFARLGVATVSNLMLVHPYSTPGTIRNALDLLERLPAGVFEATRMMVYHGTRLEERVRAEGRLSGNPFRYAYRFDDPCMERFAEVFSRLRGEAFQDYSIAYRMHDAHLALALARRVAPERVRPGVEGRLERARRAVNALYVEAYRRGIALAEEGGGYRQATPLVEEMFQRSRALDEALDAIDALLLTEPRRRARAFRPMRAAAAGALSFVLLSAGACDCGRSHTPRSADAGVDAAPADAGPCTDAARMRNNERAGEIAREANGCFSGYVALTPVEAHFQASGWSGSVSYNRCFDSAGTDSRIAAMESDVEAALEGRVPECAGPGVSVQGGAAEDLQRMAEAVETACDVPFGETFRVGLDAEGRVRSVMSASGSTEVEECVEAALAGLVFPCLASFEVCPEYVIAE